MSRCATLNPLWNLLSLLQETQTRLRLGNICCNQLPQVFPYGPARISIQNIWMEETNSMGSGHHFTQLSSTWAAVCTWSGQRLEVASEGYIYKYEFPSPLRAIRTQSNIGLKIEAAGKWGRTDSYTHRAHQYQIWQTRAYQTLTNSHRFHSPTLTNSHQVRPKSAPANPDLGLTWHLLSVIYCVLFIIILFINYYSL